MALETPPASIPAGPVAASSEEAPPASIPAGGASTPLAQASINPTSTPQEETPPASIPVYHPGVTDAVVRGLVYTESRGDPKAIGPPIQGTTERALGLAQFLPSTAKEMGIDPLNPDQALEGIKTKMSQLLDKTGGNLDKALAMYGGFKTKDPTAYINNVKSHGDFNGGYLAKMGDSPPASIPAGPVNQAGPSTQGLQASITPPTPPDTSQAPTGSPNPLNEAQTASPAGEPELTPSAVSNFNQQYDKSVGTQWNPIESIQNAFNALGHEVTTSPLGTEEDIAHLPAGMAGFSTSLAVALPQLLDRIDPMSPNFFPVQKMVNALGGDTQSISDMWKEAQATGQSVDSWIWSAMARAGETEGASMGQIEETPFRVTPFKPSPENTAIQTFVGEPLAWVKPVAESVGARYGPDAQAAADIIGSTVGMALLGKLAKGLGPDPFLEMAKTRFPGATPEMHDALADFYRNWNNNPKEKSQNLAVLAGAMQITMDHLKGDRIVETYPEGMIDPKEQTAYMMSRLQETSDFHSDGIPISDGRQPITIPQLMDLIQQHNGVENVNKVMAQYLQGISYVTGLDNTKIRLSTDEQMSAIANETPTGRLAGRNDPQTDTIHLRPDQINPSDPETMLHEPWHAITTNVLDKFETLTRIPQAPENTPQFLRINEVSSPLNGSEGPNLKAAKYQWMKMTEPMKNLMRKVEDLSDHHQEVAPLLQAAAKEPGLDSKTVGRYTRAANDIYEYVAQAMTDPILRRKLAEFPVAKTDPLNFRAAQSEQAIRTRPIINRLQEFGLRLRETLAGGKVERLTGTEVPNMLQHAVDKISGIAETIGPKERIGNIFDTPSNERAQALEKLTGQVREDMAQAGHWGYWQKISSISQFASSFREFKWQLKAISADPSWRALIQKNAPSLYAHRDNIIKAVGTNFDYEKLSPYTKAIIGDPRSARELFESIRKKLPPGQQNLMTKHDIVRAATMLLGPDQLVLMKAGQGELGIGGEITNWYLSQAREAQALKAQTYFESARLADKYTNMSRSDQLDTMQRWEYYDGRGNNQLTSQKLQWPTRKMLESPIEGEPGLKALTPKQIDAYLDVTKAVDFMLDRENDFRLSRGESELPARPGYMPHTWRGPFRVKITATEVMREGQMGPPHQFTMAVKDTSTTWQAKAIARDFNSGAHDSSLYKLSVEKDMDSGKYWTVKTNNAPEVSLAQSIQDHLGVPTRDQLSKLDPNFIKVSNLIQHDFLTGYSSRLMESSGVKGYLGEGGINKPNFFDRIGLNKRVNQFLDLHNEAAKAIADLYGNNIFMNQVYGPLHEHMTGDVGDYRAQYGEMTQGLQWLRHYSEKFAANFTGNQYDLFNKILTQEITYEPHDLFGFSPDIVQDGLHWLRNSYSLLKLRGNPKFYMGNVLQQAWSMGQLELANAMLAFEGRHTQSPWETFGKLATGTSKFKGELDAAEGWARDNHILESNMEAYLRQSNLNAPMMGSVGGFFHTVTGGKINPAIENFSRTNSYRLAYLHFREMGFEIEQSQRAAAQIMKQTNVDYNRESRPLMFQSFGIAGEFISPFQVYRNAYLGNMYLMLKHARMNWKSVQAFMPALTTMALYLGTAGFVGLPAVHEANETIDVINRIVSGQIPHLDEMLRNLQNEDGDITGRLKNIVASEGFSFGLLSAATRNIPGMSHGMYVGSSVGAPNLDQGMSSVLTDYITAMGSILGTGAQALLHAMTNKVPPISPSDLRKPIQELQPGVLEPFLEKWLFMPGGSNVVPDYTGRKGAYLRTPEDWRSLYGFGTKSLNEIESTKTNAQVNRMGELAQKYIDAQVGAAVAAIRGNSLQDGGQAMSDAVATGQIKPQEFMNRVNDEVLGLNVTPEIKEAMGQTLADMWRMKWREQSTPKALKESQKNDRSPSVQPQPSFDEMMRTP